MGDLTDLIELGFRSIPKPKYHFKKSESVRHRKEPVSAARVWIDTRLVEIKEFESSYQVVISDYSKRFGDLKPILRSTGLTRNEAESIFREAVDVLRRG